MYKLFLSLLLLSPLQVLQGCNDISPVSSLLHVKQCQLSQSVLVAQVLISSHNLTGSSALPPTGPCVKTCFPVLKNPELDAALQLGSQEGRVEGQNPLPQPATHAALDAAQDADDGNCLRLSGLPACTAGSCPASNLPESTSLSLFQCSQ